MKETCRTKKGRRGRFLLPLFFLHRKDAENPFVTTREFVFHFAGIKTSSSDSTDFSMICKIL